MDLNLERRIRILVADDETRANDSLVDFLNSRGFETKLARDAKQVKEAMVRHRPDFVIYDLMLPELNAISFLKQLHLQGQLGEGKTRVFVTSRQNSPINVRECMKLGATDFLIKPITNTDVLSRLVLHLTQKRELEEFRAKSAEDFKGAHYFMHLTDLMLREALKGEPAIETLHNLTGMLAITLKAVRVSLVRASLGNRRALVFASNDRKDIGGLEINLSRYPEMQYVLRTEKLLSLDNLAADPVMQFVTKQEKEINFNAVVVAPVKVNGQIWGLLSSRLPENRERLNDFEIRFAQLIAHVCGLVAQTEEKLLQALPPDFDALTDQTVVPITSKASTK